MNGPDRLNSAPATGFRSVLPRRRIVGTPSNQSAGSKPATSAVNCASGTGANGVSVARALMRVLSLSPSIASWTSVSDPLACTCAPTSCSRRVETIFESACRANGGRASILPAIATRAGPCRNSPRSITAASPLMRPLSAISVTTVGAAPRAPTCSERIDAVRSRRSIGSASVAGVAGGVAGVALATQSTITDCA